MKKKTVYIGVVGPELENGLCNDSIRNITIREGDSPPLFIRPTKGFEGRQLHIEKFLESDHDAILLLDSDMMFKPDTLELLRSHGKPYVSGYYMRRQFRPIIPVMYDYNERDEWPQKPMTDDPKPGELYKIGGSGWGCVYVERKVFEAVEPLLKGETFVIEDDMDVWPYDLEVMLRLIRILNTSDSMEQMKTAARILANEFRPLTGDKDNVGSDIRFPFFAKQAGFDLYLDPAVRPGHIINYPISADDYTQATDAHLQDNLVIGLQNVVNEERLNWRERIDKLNGK